MTEAPIRIGDLANRAEVSTRTVDYYTSLGLLNPAERTTGNFRLYDPADTERIQLIKSLEAQGIPLEEIATAFASRTADVGPILERIDDDLKSFQAVAESAPEAMQGLLGVIATRVHTLIYIALQIPPDIPIL
ncbi:MerR family transcriptional regulator [Nocardia sp. NPDC058480]|uniref:helix-turn-helix domain-containing protein n=1 Tax=unclassified Nocardia TaxID=2637762 RepID=UPI003646144F